MKREIKVNHMSKSVAQEIFEQTGKVVRIGGEHVWFENDELGKLEIIEEWEDVTVVEDENGVQYEATVGEYDEELGEVKTLEIEEIEE